MIKNIPGSKSILQRMLVLAAHAKADIRLLNYNPCMDVLELEQALKVYGYQITEIENGKAFCFIESAHQQSRHIYEFHNSATGFRLWLSLLANLQAFPSQIRVSELLLKRGFAPLISVLEEMGAAFQQNAGEIRIQPALLTGGKHILCGSISSQYHSSLLLAAPFMQRELSLEISFHQVSKPYIQLSAQMLKQFGAEIIATDKALNVNAGDFRLPEEFWVDADLSTAAFYVVWGALMPEGLKLKLKINPQLSQADYAIFPILAEMGLQITWENEICAVKPAKLYGASLNLSNTPDLMPILSILALFCSTPTTLYGIGRLAHKESNRVLGIVQAFKLLNIQYKLAPDELTIYPLGNRQLPAQQLDTCSDHRLVMAFSLLKYRFDQIELKESQSIEKSLPLKMWQGPQLQ